MHFVYWGAVNSEVVVSSLSVSAFYSLLQLPCSLFSSVFSLVLLFCHTLFSEKRGQQWCLWIVKRETETETRHKPWPGQWADMHGEEDFLLVNGSTCCRVASMSGKNNGPARLCLSVRLLDQYRIADHSEISFRFIHCNNLFSFKCPTTAQPNGPRQLSLKW